MPPLLGIPSRGSLHHERHVKKKECWSWAQYRSAFVISSSKAALLHRITANKQIKLRRWDTSNKAANSPTTSPPCYASAFATITFLSFECLESFGRFSVHPTSRVRLCSGQVSAGRWLCCLSGSERSPGHSPAWKELRRTWKCENIDF